MKTRSSKAGPVLAGAYILLCAFLIITQGLFGESFIALILGLPWVLLYAVFEPANVSGSMAYVLVLAPIVLNAVLLYLIGSLIGKKKRPRKA